MGVSNRVNEMIMIKKMEPVMIRPKRETPSGKYFLSNIDQLWYYHIDVVFSFLANGGKRSDTVYDVMKGSLEEALVHFYPLAGRIIMDSDDKFVVDCTGEGVPFVEAHVENNMTVLGDISFIDSAMLPQLTYSPARATTVFEKPILTVQVTRFECGGFILGLSHCQLLFDATSMGKFISSWSEIARGLPLTSPPFLDRSIFRARQPPKIEFPHHELSKKIGRKIRILMKNPLSVWSFTIHSKLLAQKKSVFMNDKSLRPPTNFEFVSALVWRNRTKALNLEPGRKTRLMITVNVRDKTDGMFPKGYFGNGIVTPQCLYGADELVQKPLSFAIKLVQETMNLVNKDYVQSFIDYFEVTRSEIEVEDVCAITKLQRLPFYDPDFGWGHPTQFAPAELIYNEIYYLSQGEGSENMVLTLGLPAPSMKIFQELMQSEFNSRSRI